MSRKYVAQVDNQNFIYPNYELKEYETELVQEINEASISGTVTNFATSFTGSNINVSFDYTWSLNGAEPYINGNGNATVLSVHMMTPENPYFRPWRMITYKDTASNNITASGTTTVTVTPAMMGESSFGSGIYNFEIRFIGHRAIYTVCQSTTLNNPAITPTPTPTLTRTIPVSATPTPTPTATAVAYVSGATINVTDTGYIKYDTASGTTYQYIGSLGNVSLTNCLVCSSITYGYPFADLAAFTIVNCGSSCGPNPTPTPTPTAGGYYTFIGCGRSDVSAANSCSDAAYNNRTFYSRCLYIYAGCVVYSDGYGTPLTGYQYIFMDGQNWDVNPLNGYIYGLSSIQC